VRLSLQNSPFFIISFQPSLIFARVSGMWEWSITWVAESWVGLEIMAKLKHASLLFESVGFVLKKVFFLSCLDFFLIFKGNSSLFIGHQMLRTDQIL
jgi:hypothetical protein